MVDVNTLAASLRSLSGKGPARAERRNGLVPAVIYGNKLDPMAISVDRKALERQIQVSGFFIRLIDVNLEGESHRVLPREVQFHPVSDAPLHVDFLRFSADRKITVQVPVQFNNEEDSPGLKRGGGGPSPRRHVRGAWPNSRRRKRPKIRKSTRLWPATMRG